MFPIEMLLLPMPPADQITEKLDHDQFLIKLGEKENIGIVSKTGVLVTSVVEFRTFCMLSNSKATLK
jgi:hypothetical protein